MTKQDYLLATNLAKVRIAADVMRDTMFMTPPDASEKSQNEAARSSALVAILGIQRRLEVELNKTDGE